MRRLFPPKRGAAEVRSGEVLPPLATLPAGGVGPARTEFTDGPGGPKLPFRDAMAQGAVFLDGYGAFGMGGSFGAGVVGTYGSKLQRQGPRAGAYAQEMMTADPVLAGLVKQKITSALGAGLQFSSALDWQALGMSEAQGRDVRNQINRNFKAWATDPLEVDYTGRSNLHDLAGAAFTSYLLSGEIVCTVDWMACNNAISKTKLSLLDARQLDYTRTLEGADGGCMNGVQFDKRGRVTGYWLRSVTYGALVNQPMPKFHRAFTSWKRPRVLHIFDNQQPGMVRGVSPLIASLSPAAERAMLSQYTLEKAVVEASFTATLESDLPEEVKFGGINAEGTVPFNGVTAAYMADPLGGRDAWYKQSRPSLKSGQINSLSPGEKLHFHTPGTPGNNFDPFNNSLIRQTAKAAGESYEAVSGDFQKSSYSASRLALEIPYRHMLVERRKILEKFYQAAFTVWVEEELYSGRIVLPSDAVPFWQNPNAYTLGAWRGMGRISPDPLKQAMADIALVGNQFTTRTEVLASYGLDFEEVMTTLSHEQTRMIELGLDPNVKGTITTQYKDVKEDDKIEEKAS